MSVEDFILKTCYLLIVSKDITNSATMYNVTVFIYADHSIPEICNMTSQLTHSHKQNNKTKQSKFKKKNKIKIKIKQLISYVH